jgi:hypothetical protein
MTTTKNSAQVIEPKARSIIYGHGRGWVFTPRSLALLGDPRSIGMALTRLTRKGVIRQLARGLYDYPVDHPSLGRIPPSADAIAKALAARDATRLQPAGAYAANVLGLSEQVPTRIVFLTDGASGRAKIGQREIVLKRTTPRNMATAGRKSGTIIQALRHIGQRNVDEKTLAILARNLTTRDRAQLIKDLHYAPGWIAELMRRLAGGGTPLDG